MKISNTIELRALTDTLYMQYLLAVTAGDIMLGEVADHLYVSDLDLKKPDRNKSIQEAVDLGFWDTIDTAVDHIYSREEDLTPYILLADRMGLDELAEQLHQYILAHVTLRDASEICNNPYYRNIHIREGSAGMIQLKQNNYLAGEFFQTYRGSFKRADPFAYADAGFFDEPVDFPVLLENGRVWMSVVSSEIDSMEEPIKAAQGEVITFGLGLGYFTYMAAIKEEVESVTVVEMNPYVISLFRKNILPQFPHPEKVRIVQADAFDFIRSPKDREYDYAFSDFWGGTDDGVRLYLDFYRHAQGFGTKKHDYWIESCFMEYFFRPALMKLLGKEILHKDLPLVSYSKEINRLMDRFIRYTAGKDITLKTAEDVYCLLEPKTLEQLVHEFAVEF